MKSSEKSQFKAFLEEKERARVSDKHCLFHSLEVAIWTAARYESRALGSSAVWLKQRPKSKDRKLRIGMEREIIG